jgi:hypothetical protein
MSNSPDSTVRRKHRKSTKREPEPIVVIPLPRHRSGWWRFVPPLLLLLLCTGFLVFRARARDWLGLTGLVDRALWSWRHVSGESPTLTSPVRGPNGAKADPAEPGQPPSNADIEDDIAREAEHTRQRIAELERIKEQEANRLAATADQRRQQDAPRARPRRPVLTRDEIERQLAVQRRLLHQQLEEMRRLQLAWVQETYRRQGLGLEPSRQHFRGDSNGASPAHPTRRRCRESPL